jgi:hypothetical protein
MDRVFDKTYDFDSMGCHMGKLFNNQPFYFIRKFALNKKTGFIDFFKFMLNNFCHLFTIIIFL